MALESGSHFYKPDGTPCHVVKAKTRPGMRPVTVRDAQELGLYPSVTTILRALAKPQLEAWKERQVALAALTYPRKPDDVLDDAFLDKIREDAFKQVDDAADLGSKGHAALEAYFSEQPHDPAFQVYVDAVAGIFQREGVHVLQRELTLVNHQEGYAGKTDLLIDSSHGMGIGDYKFRKTIPGKKATPYDGQATQIAAYHMAQYHDIGDGAAGFNLFLSSTEPGRVDIAWYDAAILRKEWDIFQHLCAVWRLRNFDPRVHAA